MPDWSSILGDPGAKPPNPVVDGYQIVRLLSEEGQGEVYLGESLTVPGQRVAIKRWKTATGRAKREEQALLALDHPNVVRVVDYKEDAVLSLPCLITAYVEAPPLLADETRLDPYRAARIVHDVAQALAYVHENGLVHRDVKPKNILIPSSGDPVLVDFGTVKLSRELSEALKSQADARTWTGDRPLGTLPYMAPEQLGLIECEVDSRSDIYALGATLYQCLTGSIPFETNSAFERQNRDVWSDPIDGAEITRVPDLLREIVRRALAYAPEARYQAAPDLIADLKRYLASSTYLTSTRRPPLVGVGVVAAVALIGLVAVPVAAHVLWSPGSEDAPKASPSAAPQPTATGLALRRTASPTRVPQPEGSRPLASAAPSKPPAIAKTKPPAPATTASAPPRPKPSTTTPPAVKPAPSVSPRKPKPTPPRQLKISLQAKATPAGVALTWSGERAAWVVERRKAGGRDYRILAQPPIGTTTYRDPTAAASTSYRYRLTETQGNRTSRSQAVPVKTHPPSRPATPSGLRASGLTATSVLLEWSSGPAGVSYELQRKQALGKFAAVTKLPGGSQRYQDHGLRGGIRYTYQLIAISPSGRSAPAEVQCTTLLPPPESPTDLKATVDPAGGVSLTWIDRSGNEAAFVISRGKTPRTLAEVDRANANATSYLDRSAKPDTTYHYGVWALGSGGRSEPTQRVSVHVPSRSRFSSPDHRYRLTLSSAQCTLELWDRQGKRWLPARQWRWTGVQPTAGTPVAFLGNWVGVRYRRGRVRVWDLRRDPKTAVEIRSTRALGSVVRKHVPLQGFCSRCGAEHSGSAKHECERGRESK